MSRGIRKGAGRSRLPKPRPEPEAGRDDRDRDVMTLRELAEYLNCNYITVFKLANTRRRSRPFGWAPSGRRSLALSMVGYQQVDCGPTGEAGRSGRSRGQAAAAEGQVNQMVNLSRVVTVVTVAMMLAACAGMNAAMQYNGTPVQGFAYNGNDWRIFDKPKEGRLMITPSIGRLNPYRRAERPDFWSGRYGYTQTGISGCR